MGNILKLSCSNNLQGSNDNHMVIEGSYVYGKATTYGFATKEVGSMEEIRELATFSAISPYLYKDGHRSKSKITGVGNILIFDIDSDHDMSAELFEKAKSIGVQYTILPTQNHLVLKNGKLMHKYRLLIPISGVETTRQYVDALHYIVQTYRLPNVDRATYDLGRFYAPTLPTPGQMFKDATGPVTADTVLSLATRLRFTIDGSSLGLPADVYPRDDKAGILLWQDNWSDKSPALESHNGTAEVTGDTLTEVHDDLENTIDETMLSYLKDIRLNIGDVAFQLERGGRCMIECPTSHLHTNQSDSRYAWLRKTGGGDVLLFCGSDHCRTAYGDSRRIVLPDWETFVSESNKYQTMSSIKNIRSMLINNYSFLLADAICQVEGVTFSTPLERQDHARARLTDGSLLDTNALLVYILSVSKSDGRGSPTVKTLTLAGSLSRNVSIKDGLNTILESWSHLIFSDKWNDVAEVTGNKDMLRGNVLKDIAQTVASDYTLSTIKKDAFRIKHSSNVARMPIVNLTSQGREEVMQTNSFDGALIQRRNLLLKEGVRNYVGYDNLIASFKEHWRLPQGDVSTHSMTVTNLPSLIMLFSTLNMLSDGEANQRGTAFVITAPPGSGKSSLIENMHIAGLTNSTQYLADIFGFEGLYPTSVRGLKEALFTTGDELSPTLIKKMSIPLLLGNLTNKEININVKGQIDSSFQSFAKVIWGARAEDAMNAVTQSAELRDRTMMITYDHEHFEGSKFKALCNMDGGMVDKCIQLHLCETYIEFKDKILAVKFEDRVALFGVLKEAIKKKYSGAMDYVMDETGVVSHVNIATDKERAVNTVFSAIATWRRAVIANPVADSHSSKSSVMATRHLTTSQLTALGTKGEDYWIALWELHWLHSQDEVYIFPPRNTGYSRILTMLLKIALIRYGGMKTFEAMDVLSLFKYKDFTDELVKRGFVKSTKAEEDSKMFRCSRVTGISSKGRVSYKGKPDMLD